MTYEPEQTGEDLTPQGEHSYRPMVSSEHAETLRRWHDYLYQDLKQNREQHISYLGRKFVVPEQVYPPVPITELLSNALLDEVKPSDRVLDMGTGSGVNAILAASISTDVVGVDINRYAIECARSNAELNGVSSRTNFFQSDVFNAVEGAFDLMIFNPPFRWYAPRDLLERSIADENYASLTRFMMEAGAHLTAYGRIIILFGTTGDIEYLYSLIERTGYQLDVLSTRELANEDVTFTYHVFRLVRR